MATVKVFLDTRRVLKDGTYPVKLRVWHRGAILLPTSLTAKVTEWGGAQYKETTATCKARNVHLRTMLNKIETLLLSLEQSGDIAGMSDKLLRSLCLEELGREKPTNALLLDYLNKAKEGRALRTRRLYEWVSRLVESYDSKARVTDVDEIWMTKFRNWLSKKLKPNSVAHVMHKILRAINLAVEDNIVATNRARSVKRPKAETRKKSLSLEAVRELRDMTFEDKRSEYARDIWMLQFYLMGINVVDLFELEKIVDGRIEYDRHKTGTQYSVKVYPEAAAIIEKYRGNIRLINSRNNSTNLQTICVMLNRYLKSVMPNLTTNCARHTWATLAAEADIPIETISHALGHKIGSPITNIYVAYNQKKVDAANRKVIDYINADIYEKS